VKKREEIEEKINVNKEKGIKTEVKVKAKNFLVIYSSGVQQCRCVRTPSRTLPLRMARTHCCLKDT
jgi:hypothetical protein